MMDEKKIANYLVCSIVLLTTIMFSWTFVYINQIAQEKVRKQKKIRNVETEISNLISFNKKRQAYA